MNSPPATVQLRHDMDRVHFFVRVHQGDDIRVVDFFREGDLVPQPILAPDAVLGDSLDGTEVGAGEVGARADPDGNAGANNLLGHRRRGGVAAV